MPKNKVFGQAGEGELPALIISRFCQHTTVGELPTGKAAKQISQYAVSEKCGLWYSKVYYGDCEKWYCSGDNEE